MSQGTDFVESSSFESDSDLSEPATKAGVMRSDQIIDPDGKPLKLKSSMAVKFAQAIRNKLLEEMKKLDMQH